jgi:RNA polymerase sigma-70 factor, ECF subfamily
VTPPGATRCNLVHRLPHSLIVSSAEEVGLLAAVARGDESAFRELYRRHTPAMYGAVLRLLARNAADAEDAVQEAWLRAVRGLGDFRGDSALRTWLIGIAIRCALEIGRRRRALTDPDPKAPDQAPSPAVRLDLEHAIASLAGGYREVVVLHDVYGYTHAEIGELLGIDEGTSKSQLSRARQALRRAMSGTMECLYES